MLSSSKSKILVIVIGVVFFTGQSAQALGLAGAGSFQDHAPSPAQVPQVLGASTFSVQVVGTSNTQAVLAYTAPDTGACTVKISENPGLVPLDHDVDPSLFAGSNLDSRAGSL